ncbi:MAG: alpha/beta hydrolase [Leptolyngbyaceae cyanobacterium bins.349]|nr:alpha/beta hydrolase [Leptolyngbyaceae cyanobacterium bins.349]
MQARLIQRSVTLGNCQIAYRQSVSLSTATPILFLHGWGISAEPYHEILDLLAASHPVIAPDLPSFADSHYPHRLETYEEYAGWILAFLEEINTPSVHIMGHSFGGGIAIALAALHPTVIKSVTLIGSTGIPLGWLPEILLRRSLEMPLQLYPPKFYLQFGEIPRVFAHNLLFNLPNVVQALWLSTQVDLRHLLPKIQAPVLLLWSEKDLTALLPVAQEMKNLIPAAQLVTVPEGYHEWVLLYPEKFTAIALDFVKTQETYRPVEASSI